MTDLANAWVAATRSTFDRIWEAREPAELFGVLGGGLWVTLVFVVVHFGTT